MARRTVNLVTTTQAEVEAYIADSYWQGVRDACGVMFTGAALALAIWGSRRAKA